MRDHGRAIRIRVGRTVQRLRLEREFSQERLAELASNSPKYIGQIERGEVNVSTDVLAQIAQALSVDIADLFTVPRGRAVSRAPYTITRAQVDQLEQIVRQVKSVRPSRRPRRA